jgi:hypothetical protein
MKQAALGLAPCPYRLDNHAAQIRARLDPARLGMAGLDPAE